MTTNHRRNICLISVIAASLLLGCTQENVGLPADGAMLMDTDSALSASGPIRLQERPTFPVDEQQRPYGIIEDQSDRPSPPNEPIRMQEAR